jgi:hypothetical protein
VRSAYLPAGSSRAAGDGSGGAGCGPVAGAGSGSSRQARCAATHLSAASARSCRRWKPVGDLDSLRCPWRGPRLMPQPDIRTVRIPAARTRESDDRDVSCVD